MSLVIDFEHHFIPADLARVAMQQFEGIEHPGPTGGKMRFWKQMTEAIARTALGHPRRMEQDVADMDEAGIDIAVLVAVGVGWEANLEGCRYVNERIAGAIARYPDRFVGLAHVTPLDGAPAVAEVRRAVHELGFRGVAIPCFVEGRNLDDRDLWPFYEAMNALKVPVFCHPLTCPVQYGPVPVSEPMLHTALVREFDIMTSVTRVVLSGLLSDFPDLKMVFCHFGGGISALRERIQRWQYTFDPPKRFEEDFRKLYFTIGGYEVAPIALQTALLGIGADRLMYGTDYPHDFKGAGPNLRAWVQHIRGLSLPVEEREMILGGNAASLLGLS